MTEIRFENITKFFGSTPIIKGLDLTIEEGEFFTFVGPSGCGKSTVLNMIAGLEQVTSGNILFDGRVVNGFSPRDRDVAMIFQSYALYPHMTVYENIAFPLKMRKETPGRIDSEVKRVAELLGLGTYLVRKPKELSGGQRQRVALGRAIVRKPKVFLMDEPLSNLDARLRIDMRAELKNLHRELGITTVYVTHDQGEAMGLSDRIAVLEKGDLQQCAVPRDVYRSPANTFVAGFIGSPPMNLVRCTLGSRGLLEASCGGMVFNLEMKTPPSSNKVVVGIRPEDIVAARQFREGSIAANVEAVEPAGSVTWVEVEQDGVKFKAISNPDEELEPGSPAYLTVSQDRISVFDGASGFRL